MNEKISLSDLAKNGTRISNPADLLPKKQVVARDAQTDALGDLGVVIQKENEEAEAIGKAMIEDMKRAKAMGLEPEFKNDPLSTEGTKPMVFSEVKDGEGVDSAIENIPVEASEALDVNSIQSIKNYVTPPKYFDTTGQEIKTTQTGRRSVLRDNIEAAGGKVEDVAPNVASQNNQQNKPSNNESLNDDGTDKTYSPDNMSEEELKELMGDDYVETQNEQKEVKEIVQENDAEVIKEQPKIKETVQEHNAEVTKEQPKVESEVTAESENYDRVGLEDDSEQPDYSAISGAIPEDEEYSEEEKNDLINSIKMKVKEKLRPEKFDLNSFTVETPVKIINIHSGAERGNIDEADWFLPSTGVNITMKRFTGTEIMALRGNSEKSVRNMNLDILRLIYDHISNPTKPEFEVWMKTVRMEDLKHLYFAIMRATYRKSSYLPYPCNNTTCKNIDIVMKPFEDMVHFYDEKDKEEFYRNLESNTYNYDTNSIETEIIQITDEYCVDLKMPTLYDILIEPTYLDVKYRKQNKESIAIISYINNIYKIDAANKKLIPIDYTLKTSDEAKIITNKYRLYMQFLNALTSDQYTFLSSLINKLTADKDICTFVIPEHKCEKCGSTIPARSVESLELLFMRHQLAAYQNM